MDPRPLLMATELAKLDEEAAAAHRPCLRHLQGQIDGHGRYQISEPSNEPHVAAASAMHDE